MSAKEIVEAFTRKGAVSGGVSEQESELDPPHSSLIILDELDNKLLLGAHIEALKNPPSPSLPHSHTLSLYSYLHALFTGSRGNSKESIRRLGKLFNVCIDLFKEGRFTKQESSELLEVMLSVIRQMNKKQTESSILRILTDFSPDSLNENSVDGHGSVLELIPQLVSRNGEAVCRIYTLETICEMTFPVTSAVILSATLVDLCESEDDLRKAINKIKAYVKWNSSSLLGPQHAETDTSAGHNQFVVEPEDLPALIYQMTCLSRKFDITNDNTLILLGKKLVIEALTEVLDFLFHDGCRWINIMESRGSAAVVTRRIHNIMSTIIHHLSLLVSKDQGISSEIVKMIKNRSMLIVRSAGPVGAESALLESGPITDTTIPVTAPATATSQPTFLTCVATASSPTLPKSAPPTSRDQQTTLSPSRLLLSLLVANAPRLEDTVLHALCESIQEMYVSQSLHLQSLWFGPEVWARASQSRVLTPPNLQQLFSHVLSGPMMVEGIVAPLMKCACGLLQLATTGAGTSSSAVSSTLKTLSSLSTSTLVLSPTCLESICLRAPQDEYNSSELAASSGPGFGAWLLIQLFASCRHARLLIIREIVLRLQMVISLADMASGPNSRTHHGGGSHTVLSMASYVPLDQSPLEKLLLGVLGHLTSSPLCLEGILESAQDVGFTGGGSGIVQELMELFLSLPSLLPKSASQLVHIMVPLLRCSSGLADRCALSLRKASFSKDVSSRLAAVSALMSLLQVQLVPPRAASDGLVCTNGSGTSSSSSSSDIRHSLPYPHQSQGHDGEARPIPGILSIEEVLSLCRRFLHYQAPVRSLLYDRLLTLHFEVLSFRSHSVRLLRNHLQSLVVDNDSGPFSRTCRIGEVSFEQLRRESQDLLSVESPRHLLFLNLDSCVDNSGQTQEAIYDLIVSLTSMLQTSCTSLQEMQLKHSQMVAAAENRVSLAENDDEAMPLSQGVPCTQYGYFSQVDLSQHASSSSQGPSRVIDEDSRAIRRAERRLVEYAQEVDDAFVILWKLCCGLARGKTSDFSLPQQPSTRQEYNRYVVLVEALQAALNCVSSLPYMVVATRSYDAMDAVCEDTEATVTGSSEFRNEPASKDAYQNTCVMQFLTPVHRIQLFGKLAQQLEMFSTVVLSYRKQEKDAEKAGGKKGRREDNDDASVVDIDGGSSTGTLALLPKHIGGFQSPETLSGHCIVLELEMCVFGLDALFMREKADDDDEHDNDSDNEDNIPSSARGTNKSAEVAMATLNLRQLPCCQFLRKHILERSLYCLELCLKYLCLNSTSTDNHCERIVSQSEYLFQCLMRVLINLRSEDKESSCELGTQHLNRFHTPNNSNLAPTTASNRRGPVENNAATSSAMGSLLFPSNSQHQYLYPNQLVLRCMLGCLRVENIHSLRLSRSLPARTTGDLDNAYENICDKDQDDEAVQYRMQRLTVLLEEGFKVGHSGCREGSLNAGDKFLTSNTTSTALTCGALTGTMREIESRLEKQAKKFLELFLLLSAPEGTERNESPLVLSLLGEVVEVLTPARRQKFQEYILKKCRDHLQSPSNAMTLGLLQLLMYKLSSDSKGRLENVRGLSSLVAECCTTEQQLDEHEAEDDEDDYENVERDVTTYTLVTKNTSATAITTLVGMLEKMCGEMDTLLKLSVKTTKVNRTILSSAPSMCAGERASTSLMKDLWGSDVSNTLTANNLNEKEDDDWRVNDQICKSLKKAMDIAVVFLTFKSPGVVCHTLLALFLKLVKLQVRMTKLMSSSPAAQRSQVSSSTTYISFRDLSLNMATNISQQLNRYITEVHNILDERRGRGQRNGGKAVNTKLSRLIPELIFQTEEIDLNVIKLMTGLKERDKSTVSKWLCKVAARDFRLSGTATNQDQQGSSGTTNQSTNKRKSKEKPSSRSSSKKRRGSDEYEPDENNEAQ